MSQQRQSRNLSCGSPAGSGTSVAGLRLAILLLVVGFGLAPAQNTNLDALTAAGLFQPTDGPTQPEMLISNVLAQMGELRGTNELGSNEMTQAEQGLMQTNITPDTNFETQPENGVQPGSRESRRQWLFRQRAGAPGPTDSAAANIQSPGSLNGPPRPDYSTFKIVAERNIFDPNRTPHRSENLPAPKVAESFGLVGVMTYEKGTFAFFDGTSSDYKKAVKPADTIAGYQVQSIEPDAVTLVAGTNQLELRVGMQLRRQESGGWIQSAQLETYGSAAPSSNASPSTANTGLASSSSDNDVLERLRKKREQE